MSKIEQLAELLQASSNTVFFGGAGVSTESGIPDFRSKTGLFAAQEAYGLSPEELLSRTAFDRNTAIFFKYYKENLVFTDVQPNAAHLALSELEGRGKLQAVITQNVDGLHQAAGSRRVLELHGTSERHYCIGCGKTFGLSYVLDDANCDEESIPRCEACGGIVRPDVVLYGEQLDEQVMRESIAAIQSAELMIVGGTSLVVYPAAGLLRYFRGDNLVLINRSETPFDGSAQLVIHETIGGVLSEAVRLMG